MFTNTSSKIFVVLFVLAVAFVTASFVAHPANIPAADRSYDSVEQVRVASVQADRSYDSVEQMRADRPDASIASGYEQIEALRIQRSDTSLAVNSGYEAIEQLRLGRAFDADRSYDNVEALRLNR